MTAQEKWIAAAFGETGLHAWAMQGPNTYAQAFLEGCTSATDPALLEQILSKLADDWLMAAPTRVLACGMKTGAYHPVPANPAVLQPVALPAKDPQLDLFALPGLKQTAPPDVMLGDETRIAGYLAVHDGWDGVICLPGLQTCWAHVSAGEIVSFQTFLTGELSLAVSHNPPLFASADLANQNATVFLAELENTLSRPEKLAAALFSVRARDLLEDQSEQQAQARVWGVLIGAELAAARPYWLGQQLAIIATPEIAALYGTALQRQGVPVIIEDANAMALAGLTTAWRQLR